MGEARVDKETPVSTTQEPVFPLGLLLKWGTNLGHIKSLSKQKVFWRRWYTRHVFGQSYVLTLYQLCVYLSSSSPHTHACCVQQLMLLQENMNIPKGNNATIGYKHWCVDCDNILIVHTFSIIITELRSETEKKNTRHVLKNEISWTCFDYFLISRSRTCFSSCSYGCWIWIVVQYSAYTSVMRKYGEVGDILCPAVKLVIICSGIFNEGGVCVILRIFIQDLNVL